MKIEIQPEFIIWSNLDAMGNKETPEQTEERLTATINTILLDHMMRHRRAQSAEELPPTAEPAID